MARSKQLFLSFLVDPNLLKRIDDWRFLNRFSSRAAAIKWLLAWALDQRPNLLTERKTEKPKK